MRIFSILLAGVMPVSCDAAAPPKATVKSPVKAVAKSAAPVVRAAPQAIGVFRLDRAPQQGSIARGTVPPGTIRLVMNGQDVDFAPDGKFVIGFGRDFDATAIIVAYLGNGQSMSERQTVAKRAWKIESLATVRRYSQPDAEFQARRPGELAQINAARRANVQSDGWRQQLIWPSKGRISGFFGSQRIYAGEPGSPHSGVDVAGGAGAPVVAPADGVVTLAAASPFTLEGNLLIIDHGMGLDSAFLHLSKIHVKLGDVVKQGQLIGAIGATGRASGPHLHWGMKWNNERIDPQPLAGPMPAAQ
ncbi:MAG: M23 family metallopeptidase [Sphingomonadales bacterium]|nr:M23 family metallopeptidase [Sphingomonadales bacterium]